MSNKTWTPRFIVAALLLTSLIRVRGEDSSTSPSDIVVEKTSSPILQMRLQEASKRAENLSKTIAELEEDAPVLAGLKKEAPLVEPQSDALETSIAEIKKQLPLIRTGIQNHPHSSELVKPVFLARRELYRLTEELNQPFEEIASKVPGSIKRHGSMLRMDGSWEKQYPKLAAFETSVGMVTVDTFPSYMANPIWLSDFKANTEAASQEVNTLSKDALVQLFQTARANLVTSVSEAETSNHDELERALATATKTKKEIDDINTVLLEREGLPENTVRGKVRRFVQDNWQWLWTTFLVPVAIWIRRQAKKKQRTAARPKGKK